MTEIVRLTGTDICAETLVEVLKTDAVVIAERVLADDVLDPIRREVEAVVSRAPFGGSFGGEKTQRACGLLGAAPSCRPLVTHPVVLGAARSFLAPWADVLRLHLLQAIYLHPGQPAQPIHRDRLGFGRHLPRAIEPQLNTIWALTRFTEENGATRLVPGSHLWPEGRAERADEVVAATMPAGSVLIYSGSIMHGGGPNSADEHRLGLNIGYSLSWLRQEENQYLSNPPALAQTFDPELRALLGYAMSDRGMGYFGGADGRIHHPEKAVGDAARGTRMGLSEYIEHARTTDGPG